jgi:hypothetical protein
VLLGFQRHRPRRYGIRDGRSGSVTVIRHFGGRLNLNVHYHTLLFDGVFFIACAGPEAMRPLDGCAARAPICSGPRWRRTGSGGWTMGASSSR